MQDLIINVVNLHMIFKPSIGGSTTMVGFACSDHRSCLVMLLLNLLC